MVVRVHIIPWDKRVAPEIFGGIPSRRYGFRMSFVASMALHCAAPLLVALIGYAMFPVVDEGRHTQYVFQDLSVRRPPLARDRLAVAVNDRPAVPVTKSVAWPGRKFVPDSAPILPDASAFYPRPATHKEPPDGSIRVSHRPDGVADVVLEGAQGDLAPEVRELL